MSAKNGAGGEAVYSLIVPTRTLAALFDLSDRRIRQMASEGVLVREKNGRFALFNNVKLYLEYLRTKKDATIEVSSPEKTKLIEQALHERVKREISEVKLARIRADVHDADVVEAFMGDMIARCKAKLRGIPVKVAATIAPHMNTQEIADILLRDIDEALLELSDYNPDDFASAECFAFDDGQEDDDED